MSHYLGVDALLEQHLGIRKVQAHFVKLVFDRICEAERTILSQPRVTGVPHDCQQPRPAIATVVTAKGLKGAQVSFLDQVLSVMLVVYQPAREVVCGAQMRQSNLFKPNGFALVWQRSPSLVPAPAF